MNQPSIKKQTTLPEMPRELVSEARKSFEQVSLKVTRQGDRGQWSTLFSGVLMATGDLFTLEEWLQPRSGGGKYMVHATDPADRGRYVVPPFFCPIEGPPRPFTQPGAQPPTGAAPAVLSPHSPSYPHPTSAPEPNSFMTQTPDAVAQEARREVRTDYQNERALREDDRKRHLREKSTQDQQLSTLREELAQIKANSQQSALEAKLEGLTAQITQQQNAPKPQTTDWVGIASVAAAFVPAMTALISSGKDRAATESARMQSAQDANTKLMLGVMTNNNKPSDPAGMIKVMGAVITPLVPLFTQVIENRNPTKSVEMMTMLGDQMLTQASLAGEMIRQIAGDQPDQPPWMPIVQQLASGLEDFGKMMMDKDGAPVRRQPEQPALVQPAQPQVVAAPPPQAVQAAPVAAAPREMDAEQSMHHVMGQLPAHLHSKEWAEIVFYALEEAEANITGIGESASDYLHALLDNKMMPMEMEPFVQDPRNIGPLFYDLLPISTEYADKLMRATVDEFTAPAHDSPGTDTDGETAAPTRPSGPTVVEVPPEARVVTPGDPAPAPVTIR